MPYLWDGQGRTPLLLKDIQTDTPITIDVRMEDLSLKSNLKHVTVSVHEDIGPV